MARILVTGFCSYPAPDRPGVQLGHVIAGLSREHKVDVLAVRRREQAHVERIGSCRILRVPIADSDLNTRIDSFRRALRRQLEGADYDVVHFRDGWTGVTALELQAQHRYATVFDLARSPTAEPMLTDLATATELERAELTCVRRANMVLAPTEQARRYLVGVTEESKVHVVPVGVNIDHLDWESGVPGGAPLVLYLGSLTPGRGVRVLLRAMLDVASASRAVLVLGGPVTTNFAESLTRAVSDFHLTGRVRLIGEVPRSMVASVISRATVCVAPSAAELEPTSSALYPTKILDYMACKRAVVAPRRGTVEMLMRDDRHGLLFQPGDPGDLADKLLAIIHGPALRDRLAEGGYQLVRQSHTASATRRQLRSAYAWLAQDEAFRERFVRSRDEDSVSASITDLGVDLHDVGSARSQETHYEGETLLLDTEGPQAGDVTRVEVNPFTADEAPRRVAQANRADTEMPTTEHDSLGQEEGTDQWAGPLEDPGQALATPASNISGAELDPEPLEHPHDEKTPKTVVTAPLDQSLVVGELRSRTPRPELVQPVGERGTHSPPTRLTKPFVPSRPAIPPGQSIPPASRAALAKRSDPAPRQSAPRSRDPIDEDAQTRIVSSPLAMIEDSVELEADDAIKTAIVHRDDVQGLFKSDAPPPAAPQVAPSPVPRAPKVPGRVKLRSSGDSKSRDSKSGDSKPAVSKPSSTPNGKRE